MRLNRTTAPPDNIAEELRKLLGFVRALAPPSKEADRGKQKAK